jgi:hypothetical protein
MPSDNSAEPAGIGETIATTIAMMTAARAMTKRLLRSTSSKASRLLSTVAGTARRAPAELLLGPPGPIPPLAVPRQLPLAARGVPVAWQLPDRPQQDSGRFFRLRAIGICQGNSPQEVAPVYIRPGPLDATTEADGGVAAAVFLNEGPCRRFRQIIGTRRLRLRSALRDYG